MVSFSTRATDLSPVAIQIKGLNPDAVLVSDDVTADHASGDLLFFSDRDDRRITHVGIATGNGGMIHSALARGGIAVEPELSAKLKEQGVGIRRAL